MTGISGLDSNEGHHLSPALKTTLMSSLGLGLYWIWRNCINSFDPSLSWLELEGSNLQKSLPCIGALLAAVVLMLSVKMKPSIFPIPQRTVLVIGGTCSIGSVAISASGPFPSLIVISNVLQILVFALGLILLVLWGEVSSRLPTKQLAFCVAGSFIVGGIGYFLSSALPSSIVLSLFVSALPLLSALIHTKVKLAPEKQISSKPTARNGLRTSSLIILSLLVLFVGVEETLRVAFTQLSPQSVDLARQFTLLTQIGGLLIAAITCLSILVAKRAFALDTMTRVLLPFLVLSFSLLLFFRSQDVRLSFIILGAGYWCLRLFIWILAASMSRCMRISPILAFAPAEGGIALAVVIAQFVGYSIGDVTTSPSVIVAISIFIVVAGAMVLLSNNNVKALHSLETPTEDTANVDTTKAAFTHQGQAAIKTQDDKLAKTITAISESYGLTPREREVFAFLARGRNLPYIQDRLGISLGTAQAHVQHIYSKLGVHARQELLDLIEGATDTQNDKNHCTDC